MITHILRLIPNFLSVTRNSLHQLSVTAGTASLILKLKNLIDETKFHPSGCLRQSFSASLRFLKLKTWTIHPQNPLQPVFIKQEEFVFGEGSHSNHLPR
jgi:hypothetical protein